MPDQPYYVIESNPSAYTNERKFKDSSWIFIGLLVLSIHLFLPWLSDFSTPPPKKQFRQKVVVQTVRISPKPLPAQLISQAEPPQIKSEKLPVNPPAPLPPPPAPIPEILPPPPTPTPIPEIPLEKKETKPLPEPIQELVKEELVKTEPPKEEPPKPEPKEEQKIIVPTPPKKENPPPKPILKSAPAPKQPIKPKKKPESIKKPTPVTPKKPVESPKKENKEQLAALEAEKKKQLELKNKQAAEKKQKEAEAKEAEKKRQEEAAKKEATRKRQLEIEAEVGRKRQAEIAAIEAARCQTLLAKAQENLAKNKESRDKGISTPGLNLQNTAIPTIIGNLQIDALPVDTDSMATWTVKEVNYRDEVAQILHGSLRLPEFGSIKIELTINKTGKVEKVKIVSSESAKNKQYIEQKISSLQFPSFGKRFPESSHCTFSVTLNNERSTL